MTPEAIAEEVRTAYAYLRAFRIPLDWDFAYMEYADLSQEISYGP